MSELKEATYCSECFRPISDTTKLIRHNGWDYCDADCLDERINLNFQAEWVAFKNSIDLLNNEKLLGSLTL
mgnify:CR=1 FL=1|tara:strand:- start:5153 stop:5365 length:213 start_codon:yes stop_codon:yes gene_type:complete